MTDVLFCAINDWANAGSLMAKSLRTVGVDAKCAVRFYHSFKYIDEPIQWLNIEELQQLVDKSGVIVLMHSDEYDRLRLNNHKVAVFHGGSKYRKYWQKLNPVFEKRADVVMIQTGDLLQFGPKDAYLVMPPVDTVYLEPDFTTNHPPVFAHHPSNKLYKGSNPIKQVMASIPDVKFNIDLSILPWENHLDRLRKCDIYIERMSLTREGLPTGTWGMSSMEAAALGKVVITNDLWRDTYYKRVSCKCPLFIANNEPTLREVVNYLLSLTTEEIIELKKETRNWIVDTHSMESTGKQLKEILL